jgi:hypothetical protein
MYYVVFSCAAEHFKPINLKDMSNNEILEANKLIADFMGVEIGRELYSWRIGCTEPLRAEHLAYDKSWGWLMPVLEKISKYVICGHPPFNSDQFVRVEIVPNGYVKISNLRDTPITTNVSTEGGLINATFKAAIKFVEWHNKNVEIKNVQPNNEPQCGVGENIT